MKKYAIELEDELSLIYEEIAEICNEPIEKILQDTLFKVMDIISRKASKE